MNLRVGRVFSPGPARALGLMLMVLVSVPAQALTFPWTPYDDEEAASKAEVVQTRQFGKYHEFSVGGGILPGDALYTGLAGTVRYVLHLSDLWALELASASYSFNLGTGAQKRMLDRYRLEFTDTERMLVMGEVNAVIKPFYGKFAVFNRWIWYAEPYLVAGWTLTRYTASWRTGPDVGLGVRLHIFDWLALHLDARYYNLWSGIPARPTSIVDAMGGPSTLTNVYYVGGGVSFLVWDRGP